MHLPAVIGKTPFCHPNLHKKRKGGESLLGGVCQLEHKNKKVESGVDTCIQAWYSESTIWIKMFTIQ